MEIDYHLTRAQEQLLKPLHKLADEKGYSWCILRLQGTGLKFWRIVLSNKPEWAGTRSTVDAKTLKQTIAQATAVMQR